MFQCERYGNLHGFIQFLREYVCLYIPYTLPWDSANQDSQQKSPSFLIIKVTRHWAISKSQQMWMRTELFIQMSPPPMCPIAFLFNYKKYWAISNILTYILVKRRWVISPGSHSTNHFIYHLDLFNSSVLNGMMVWSHWSYFQSSISMYLPIMYVI